MERRLFVVISSMPERLSRYVNCLRQFVPDYLFFSEVDAFERQRRHGGADFILWDDVDGHGDVEAHIQRLQRLAGGDAAIIAMVHDNARERGVRALAAGAHDYVCDSMAEQELAVRVRMHVNNSSVTDKNIVGGNDIERIYPLEDRAIIKVVFWQIENNITQIRTLSELALAVGHTERELNRVFKHHYNKSAAEYLRDYRMKRARELLTQTRLPVIQIAEALGYSSAANFATAFRTAVGVSPTQYRLD